ncbi:molecular chaperone DnaJ [Synoicihabitans lomoniglobus]|uniref:Molecular chaperone DnaJ n=1 Tax=Synoicihabitans lomoniglobus TaxID=2909285 RepID=A0AAF0CRI4_9BACT|nr:molecular chaperone DnaJ [Opitutaceae bacterium LMO-M01]WED66767.1 molecular chaperone DnaJ [Opitutaceae bacterium LMO-M01]
MSEARAAQFQKLVDQQPENDLFRFSLAQALEAAGRAEQAVPHYAQCVAAKADWMMPRILLGKLQLKLGRRDAAKPILEDALRLALAQDHEDPAAELQLLLAELESR